MDKPFDTKKWAQAAIFVQDACNLSGIVRSFSQMLTEMVEAGLDTTARNTHPLSVLFSNKISSLTGSESSLAFSKAYDWAKKNS